ncbi:histidine phosphatase family protein [Roseiarcaceae bacterium H3SJ34-1]|uniref:SixA phosphatase family protein n=1 Tax=Terripilifer ovatus TaxID=3032367 RepID=UPI003AB96088|nr:histidine phosphatase family protein [Roseiarcaceae bacterium H3SJ34-1]
MLQLLLLRHAKTERSSPDGDHGRALTKRGTADSALMGAYLHQHKLVPDRALVSDALRTRQTYDIAAAKFRSKVDAMLENEIYLADSLTLLRAILQTPDDVSRLLVVGHNPGIAELAHSLSAVGDEAAIAGLLENFPTAALAIIEFNALRWLDIADTKGRLMRFVTAKSLRSDTDGEDE